MCNFFSGYALRPIGDAEVEIVDHAEITDGHALMIQADGVKEKNAALYECVPPKNHGDIGDIEKWVFRWDTGGYDRKPDWVTPEIEANVISKVRARIASMIISESPGKPLLGGCWIVIGESCVKIYSGRVFCYNYSTVTAYDSSTVKACGSSTVTAYDSSTVSAYNSSTVSACDSSTVAAYDSSTVSAYNSSTVSACDSSTVSAYAYSTVTAYGSSTVKAYGSSTVKACDSSTVRDNRIQ